ncbi:MAG: epimerase [Planctomycetes bacterium]|nr:epimerase [Planctomycetota bacterium]
MKIVITGGAGFLGFHLAQGMREHELVLLDIAAFVPSEVPEGAQTVQADVRDREALRAACAGADVIVHAAAALPLWKPAEIRSVNLDGTRAVLEVAQELGVPRVVHISSTAVYGIPDHHPLDESDPMDGVGPYGESKVAAEELCQEARAAGQCVCVLRPKTFIGPERLGVFQILFDWVDAGVKIPVIGNGRNRYQLLAVEDLVEAARLACTAHAEQVNDVFNVGAAAFDTVGEDLGALFAHAGTGSRLFRTPAWLCKSALAVLEFLRLSPLYKWIYGTADQDSFVSIDKLRGLGWEPKYSNAQTLIATYDWYKANKDAIPEAGTGHRVPWKEGALRIVRWFLR